MAEHLRAGGREVVVPPVEDDEASPEPFWRQHAESVAAAIPTEPSVALVAHSAAAPLLPAIGRALGAPPAAYVLVDALIPRDGVSRIGLLSRVSPEAADELRIHLSAGGRSPSWTEDQLAAAIPNVAVRRRVLAEMRPRGRAFFEEPVSVPGEWPDAPCGYLQLSAFYLPEAAVARSRGWPVRVLRAEHFHPVVDPGGTAGRLTELLGVLGA